MDWRKYINSDPNVLAGKPAVKGTRLSVEFILGLMAKGWTEETLLENYDRLKPTHNKAIYAFSANELIGCRVDPFRIFRINGRLMSCPL